MQNRFKDCFCVNKEIRDVFRTRLFVNEKEELKIKYLK